MKHWPQQCWKRRADSKPSSALSSPSPCRGGHAPCVTSSCKSHHQPVWQDKKMGVPTDVWRKPCHSLSQTVQVSWNDSSRWEGLAGSRDWNRNPVITSTVLFFREKNKIMQKAWNVQINVFCLFSTPYFWMRTETRGQKTPRKARCCQISSWFLQTQERDVQMML